MEEEIVHFGSKKITLSNGYEMPLLGLGTYRVRESETLHGVIDLALGTGYRLFDTAAVYGNEQFVGNSLRHLMHKYGLTRKDIFVTTKLSPSEHGYQNTIKALEKSLLNLGLEYVDLYLIHFPGASRVSIDNPVNTMLRHESWQGMVKLYERGKAKCIGVSNFNVKHLVQLSDSSNFTPMVNQVEWHPHYFQPELQLYCQENGIALQAYCPFGGLSIGDSSLIKDPIVLAVARRYDISPSQVLLLWSVQRGISVVPKSVRFEHIKLNYRLTVRLSTDDLILLDGLNKHHKYTWDPTPVV